VNEICAWADWRGLHDRVARNLVTILREVTEQRDRDKVQHDRVDNFMRSELCFENSGDAAPDCAGRDRRDAAQRQKHDCRQVKKGRDRGIAWVLNAELESDPCRGKRGNIKLAL